jgi:DMSO/TMAO reductase YedYZ molybdopterin-dependent catalytic subunit
MSNIILSRRQLLVLGATGSATMLLSGCDRISSSANGLGVLQSAEKLSQASQRLLLSRQSLSREFSASDISRVFKANGSVNVNTVEYQQALRNSFADWRLVIDGLVERPQAFSLAQLKAMPARTQITRHDCVEGWSAIGGWTGVPLANLLQLSGLKPRARFLVFHCADSIGGEAQKGGDQSFGRYYESIDLIDAVHPQTILAYAMNGANLPVAHGAPLRLRVERQLGYKHAKYVMRIEATESLQAFGRGKGGFWEDRGYEWYAGI